MLWTDRNLWSLWSQGGVSFVCLASGGPDKMLRWILRENNARGMKPTPTDTFSKPFYPEEREAHIRKIRDVIGWLLEAQICFKRRTLPHQESCTLTILPVSPDKAAVLLLLARNECVGVSSLLTTLLSHGLSCRRRAKCHHISKMLAGILSRGKRAQSITPIAPNAGP